MPLGTGHGVAGMRERVELAGGTLRRRPPRATPGPSPPTLPGRGRVTVRVALVDDQAMFRAGIAMVLDSQPDLEVVGQAEDGDEVPALVERCSPTCVVMDVRMARVDGVTATRRLHERSATRRRGCWC